LPGPPDTPRWAHLAKSTPTYWYRLMQPWVCLGILHHVEAEPWPASTRRAVLVDLAFGVEDWVSDSALFALVTARTGSRSGGRRPGNWFATGSTWPWRRTGSSPSRRRWPTSCSS